MNKGLIIKLVTVLVVAVVVYSVFWFFKLGQLEKKVNKFATDNAAHVSVGEIAVSGFPLSQKITIKDFKFSIPTPALDKRQVLVKQLEASAGMFSSEFVVTITEAYVQDAEGMLARIEFNSAPKIMASIDEGRIVKLTYSDSGYRIADDKQNLIYAASSSNVNIEAVTEGEKVVTKISATVNDIENFAVLDIYKNSVEKSIMNGLKTGEIVIGNAATALIPAQLDAAQNPVASVSALTSVAPTPMAAAPVPTAPVAVAPAPAPVASTNLPNPVAPAPTENVDAATQTPAVVPSATLKSNFSLNAEYVLAPSHVEAQPILDPTKIQDAPMQYTKTLKIINLSFSNSLYTITANGEMTALADDSMPSGALSIKVENIDNVTKQFVDGFNEMANKPQAVQANPTQAEAPANLDVYNDFLRRISANLGNIVKEISAKNAVSKDNVAQFDVRREKNLDFLVNETPMREVLGKF